MNPKLRLDEYTYVRNNDTPFVDIVLVYDDEYAISFKIKGKTMEMSVENSVPVEIVEEAIAIVKNSLLDFYNQTL